jgi:hypothetical protein
MITQTIQPLSQAVFANPNSATVQAIKVVQLAEMLMNHKGSTAVTIVTRTEPEMRKTGNPFLGNVFKVSRVNGMIGFNYANSVNNQLNREDKNADFIASPRKWGNRLPRTPIVEHKGNLYLEMKVEKSLGHRYEDASGIPLDDATMLQVSSFLPNRPKAQSQGTDKEIILRDYKLASILSITYRGTCYLVTH